MTAAVYAREWCKYFLLPGKGWRCNVVPHSFGSCSGASRLLARASRPFRLHFGARAPAVQESISLFGFLRASGQRRSAQGGVWMCRPRGLDGLPSPDATMSVCWLITRERVERLLLEREPAVLRVDGSIYRRFPGLGPSPALATVYAEEPVGLKEIDRLFQAVRAIRADSTDYARS